MNMWQTLGLGLIQGLTELFPVSSLGHAVVVPAVFRWSIRQTDRGFVPYLVLLHAGTATALLVLYRREWLRLATGFLRAAVRGKIEGDDERLAFVLVAGTVPAGLLAFMLERPVRDLFASPRLAAGFLTLNGMILAGTERLRRRTEAHIVGEQSQARPTAASVGFGTAVAIGIAQALALLPGISRSGITMAGGLLGGLTHEEAAHLSFLLATPIIGLAAIAEVPQLFGSGLPIATYLAGAVLAGLAAYGSARFLLRYFRTGRLNPYAAYCLAFGAAALVLLP